jgi:hypothetical protein
LNLSEIPNIHCQRSRTRRSCQKNWVPKGKIRKRQNSVLFNLRFFFLSTQYCQFNARETKNWEVFRFLSTLDPPPRFNNVSKKNQLLCKNACKLQCVFLLYKKCSWLVFNTQKMTSDWKRRRLIISVKFVFYFVPNQQFLIEIFYFSILLEKRETILNFFELTLSFVYFTSFPFLNNEYWLIIKTIGLV